MHPLPRGSRRRSAAARSRAIGALLVACAVAAALAACAPSDPPPTSPLGDGRPEPAAPPGVATGTPPPLGTPEATPAASPGNGAGNGAGNGVANGTGGGPDHEGAAGLAIDLVAEWLDIPATELDVASVEEVEWGSACLGVDRPYLACADVVTPGVRVELQTLLRASVHVVHVSRSGRALWAHDREAQGEIRAVDQASGTITVATARGEETWLLVPGSELEAPPARLAPGTAVTAGLDGTVEGDAIVWLVAR